jgi:hypothetical protein
MGELDAGQCNRRTPEGLEASHRGASTFDRPMILLDELVEVLATPHLNVLLTLMEANPTLGAQYGIDHEKLIAQLPVEYIDQAHPNRTGNDDKLLPATNVCCGGAHI